MKEEEKCSVDGCSGVGVLLLFMWLSTHPIKSTLKVNKSLCRWIIKHSCLHISPYLSFLTLVPSLSHMCAPTHTHAHTHTHILPLTLSLIIAHTHTHTPSHSLSYNSIYTGHLRITQVSNPCNIVIFIPRTFRSSSRMQTHSHIRIQLTIHSSSRM